MERDPNLERYLTEEEKILIKALVANTYKESEIVSLLPKYIVKDMHDGGMGSLKFVYKDLGEQVMGSCLVGGDFRDADGVLVSVAVNLDKLGNLYELDVWKTNSEPLIRYPQAEEITFPPTNISFTPRHLTEQECSLISALVVGTCKKNEIIQNLQNYIVQNMRDGSMGSLWFTGKNKLTQFLGSILAEGIFLDEDNSLVSARINLDKEGDLYQLDMWKFNRKKLLRYPKPEDITILRN